MIRLRVAALLFLVASPLFAYRSLTADPRGTSLSGFRLVHLRSNGDVYFNKPSWVLFGDQLGQIVEVVNPLDLLVAAPQHDPGFVTVTVRQDGVDYTTIEPFGYAMTEEVLLPIAVDELPGANGTRWSTEIWVHNDADHDVPIDPEYCNFIGAWFPCSRPVTRVAAHATVRMTGRGTAEYPYGFFFPPLQDADSLHYSIVVRELSTGKAMTVAAVRQRDRRNGRMVFPAIANDSSHRAALRIYSGAPRIVVSIADAATGKVLDVRTFNQLIPTDAGHPTFLTTVQDLFSTPEVRAHERLDVTVDAGDGNWALLTLTDNATQQVTAFTP
ncbi:MAG TPA: hypothetical protein VJZ76_13125 [Thermoanaerobaculia bacterium]|nr:hypothetical protein [Thermoanaerobaculia bacterium]